MINLEAIKARAASAKPGGIYPGKMAIIGNHLVVKVDGCTCYGGGPNGHESWCGHEPIQNLAELDGYPDVEGLNAKIGELRAENDRLRALQGSTSDSED